MSRFVPKNRHLKKEAYRIYNSALKNGSLFRPNVCSRCGSKTSNIDGHHLDYRFPLDVIWLCDSCHAATHSFWELSPRSGRTRLHEDDKARKRAWWNKHRAKNKAI